jgi:putative transposase
VVGPAAKKAAVAYFEGEHKFSERRACRLLRLHRGTKRYRRQKVDDPKLIDRLKELAARRRKFGYRRLHTLLKREGFKVNQKKIRRIYREQRLSIKLRKRTKIRSIVRVPIAPPRRANERWSMDFVSDQLGPTGRRFRTLTVVDEFTRESLVLYVDFSIPGATVVRELEKVRLARGTPKSIVIDNGSEFTGRAMDAWAHANGIALDFIRPGKPQENAFIESFNGKFREECLSENWFVSLEDARWTIEEWRLDYNNERPHSSLGDLTPAEFAAKQAG